MSQTFNLYVSKSSFLVPVIIGAFLCSMFGGLLNFIIFLVFASIVLKCANYFSKNKHANVEV